MYIYIYIYIYTFMLERLFSNPRTDDEVVDRDPKVGEFARLRPQGLQDGPVGHV